MVNHESGTIYNDITRFNANQVDEALKNFAQYPAEDSTIIVRGSDGLLLKKKGNEQYVVQDLAYLYNDYESQGVAEGRGYGELMAA